MNYGYAANSIPRRALAIGVVSSAVLVGVSEPAYGLTASEVIRTATHDPIIMFCGGCAAGAICAGLAVGLGSRAHYRKRLKSYMRDAQVRSELDGTNAMRIGVSGAREGTRRRAQVMKQPVQRSVVTHDQPSVQEPVMSAVSPSQTNVIGAEQRRETSRGVRSLLLERLGTGVFDEPLVIDRGAERDSQPTDFVQPRVTSSFSPVGRAAIIDSRLPRFDESLFPDISRESNVTEEDDFELAMKAMERSMAQPVQQAQPVQPVQPARHVSAYEQTAYGESYRSHERTDSTRRPSFGEGRSFDASSYVDYLLNDEMERKDAHPATHFGKPHFTVFEGTGDLGAARTAAKRQPKHFARATREA